MQRFQGASKLPHLLRLYLNKPLTVKIVLKSQRLSFSIILSDASHCLQAAKQSPSHASLLGDIVKESACEWPQLQYDSKLILVYLDLP